jgi:hypothetical protein
MATFLPAVNINYQTKFYCVLYRFQNENDFLFFFITAVNTYYKINRGGGVT